MKSKSTHLAFAFYFNHIKRIILFAFTFGGLKLNAITASLLLSNFFPSVEEFGKFEYAISLGLLISVALNCGLQAAIPYFLINKKRKDFEVIFYFHGILLISIYALFRISLFILESSFSATIILSASIALIFALQILVSVIFKSKEKIYNAVFLEGTIFLILNAYNLYLFYKNAHAELGTLQQLLNLQIGLLALLFVFKFNNLKGDFKRNNYFSVLKFGKPILYGTIIIMLLTGTGRIFTEYFFDLEAVALYGVYFRLAAVMVIVHQVVNIVFFKKIYSSNYQKLDFWFASFLALISFLCIPTFFIVPEIAKKAFELVLNTWHQSSPLFIALTFQMFFWIAHSLFENIIVRENLTPQYNIRLLILLIAMIITLGILHLVGVLTLPIMVLVNSITIFIGIEFQFKLLKNVKGCFPKTSNFIRIIALIQFIFLTNQFI